MSETEEKFIITPEPSWKQHLCYEALKTPVLDPEDGKPLTVEVFFGGGANGGKSWAICESRLMNALLYPGYKSFIGRNELKRLMQSTYVTWLEVCRYHKVPREEWRLDGQMHVIRFKNGSSIDLLDIKFLPSEDPLYERFGSTPYSDGAIDEAGESHPLAREVLKTRCGRWLNDELHINPSLLETGNPKKNWTYHLFYKPWVKGELPIDRIFIQALDKVNPKGQSSYSKNLDRIADPVMRARLRDGNWEYEDDPSSLMDYPSIVDMFTNTIDDDADDSMAEDRWMSVDVARMGKDRTVATLWRGWVAYKILYREKQDTRVTAEWLAELASENEIPYSHIVIDEDGIGGGVLDNMRGCRGFLANAAPIEVNEDEEEEIISNVPAQRIAFSNLKTQCAYHLADRVNRHEIAVRVKDEEIRTWLTEELEQIKEENVDSENKRKLVPKEEVKIILNNRSPDFADTFIMRALFDLKPPAKPQQTWQRTHTPQRRG
jgi:hypothetical protein